MTEMGDPRFQYAPNTVTARWEPLPRASHSDHRKPHAANLPLIFVWLLAVAGVVAWRKGVFFDGGVDIVVILKAMVQISALVMAWILLSRSQRKHPMGVRSISLLTPVVAISVIGATAAFHPIPGVVLGLRVLIIAVTVMLIFRTYGPTRAFFGLMVSMAIIGLVSTFSGLLLGGPGRLTGGIPPLSPNEIALLVGAPALTLVHAALRARLRPPGIVAMLILIAVLIMTESRTALIAAGIAFVLMLLFIRVMPISVMIGLLMGLPLATAAVAYTPVLTNFLNREDSASLLTLNSRTISWTAVLSLPADSWQRWVGAGLNVKTISVEGQYWDEQVFDSSWISLLAQAGIIGTVLVASLVIATLFGLFQTKKLSSLMIPIFAFILIRSFMENGLVDAGTIFLLFFVIALTSEQPRRCQLYFDAMSNEQYESPGTVSDRQYGRL